METRKDDRLGIVVFLIPGMILFTLFFIIPVIYVVVVSFADWNGFGDFTLNGIDNYIEIFQDDVFLRSIGNNIIWSICACAIQVPLAMVMALILSSKPKAWKFFRTVYFFPQVVSGIALAMLWQAVYNAEFGLLNGLLEVMGLGHLATNWLGNPDTALAAVVVYWLFYIGYYMVIIMSDIAGIDRSLYEAADIDGATKLQQDRHITIPLIRTSLMTCITLSAILGLRTFEQVYTLTNGGPFNRTSVMVMYLYKELQNISYGTASAAAVVLIAVGTGVILAIRKIFAATAK